MGADDPVLDGRTQSDLLDHLRDIAPYYTSEWNPDADDFGNAVLETFSSMAGDVVERLDQVPEKHFVAFLDELGFSSRPARPARVPVTFHATPGIDENVPIPAETTLIADATDERPEQPFQIPHGEAFEATPARLRSVYSVDPRDDAIFEHEELVGTGDRAQLFAGRDRQAHRFYIGDEALLTATPGTRLTLTLETDLPAAVVRDVLVWEYYGEQQVDGEVSEGWHSLRRTDETDEATAIRAVDDFLDRFDRLVADQGYRRAQRPDAVRIQLRRALARAALTGEFDVAADIPDALIRADDLTDDVAQDALALLASLASDLTDAGVRDEAPPSSRAAAAVELSFELPGEPTATTIEGIESKWLRCRVPDGVTAPDVFDGCVESITLETVAAADSFSEGISPSRMLSNDVPLDTDPDGFHPFGDTPRRRDAFYIASEEAFTNCGRTIEIDFRTEPTAGSYRRPPKDVDASTPTDSNDTEAPTDSDTSEPPPREVSWEYWNGSGWAGLPEVRDGTQSLTTAGTVAFTVPDDIEGTGVAGHDDVWIRCRLLDGGYGSVQYEEGSTPGTWKPVGASEMRLFAVTIYATNEAVPATLIAENNLESTGDLATAAEPIEPFKHVREKSQTLYLGFDDTLRDGPIQLYVSLSDTAYPDGFYSRLRWEYRETGADGEWVPLDVEDGTEGLTESGLVRFVFPAASAPTRSFGETRHWIRARVTGDAFTDVGSLYERTHRGEPRSSDGPEPLEETLATEPPNGIPRPTRPLVAGLYTNGGWASNVERIADVVVGSSDGSPHQTFSVSPTPVLEESIWVDELSVLSPSGRSDLEDAADTVVDVDTDSSGQPTAFRVQWHRIDDLGSAGPDERCYTLDRSTGQIEFGDGVHGRIPPRGRDGITATYRTGGGVDGNVDAGTITSLQTSIPLLDSVTNPVQASGGSDGESPDDVLERGPKELRDRGRAVTADDFERVAHGAAREIDRAYCLEGMDRGGDHAPGWVTLIVVPSAHRRKPVPKRGLLALVRDAMTDRAPASLIESDRLVIRGPSYVEVSVETTVHAPAAGSLSALEGEVADALADHFHPLTGGKQGDGWTFGELPHLSGCYAVVEGVADVDHVRELTVTFSGVDHEITVGDGDEIPNVARDVLICSGRHDVTARGGR